MRTFVFRQWKEGCRKPGKANGIAKYLENHGIHKKARQNGKNPLFDAALIRRIIQNPVYSGKISYGRRRTEKVHLSSRILKYPVCGAEMYGNSTILGVCRQWIRCEGKFILA